jgi:hypothetical protein
VTKSARGCVLPFTLRAGASMRGVGIAGMRGGRDGFRRKVALCSNVLSEATRLLTTGRFVPPLSQLLWRAEDMLDELDEALIGFDPVRDHEAFVLAATLHRKLEQIQSQLPREYRRALRTSP